MSLVEEVANVIGYGIDVAGADIDTVAKATIRVVLDRMQADLWRRDVEASYTMAGGLNWLMVAHAFREARKELEGTNESGLTP